MRGRSHGPGDAANTVPIHAVRQVLPGDCPWGTIALPHHSNADPMRRLLAPLLAFLLSLTSLPGHAQGNGFEAVVYNAVDRFLATQTQGLPGRVSSSIGALDPRTQLTPCPAVEAFLPNGARLWGHSTVGVRCNAPAGWTVFVPVTVSVMGNYLVSARPLAPNQPLQAADVALASGDLATLPAGVVTDAGQLVGKSLRNAIAAGQPIRADQLIAPLVVRQGQPVKLVSQGAGFSVSAEGTALSNAAEGQPAQVRTANGQTVSGTARAGGIVEVSF